MVQSKQVYLPPELTSCSHVFVEVDSTKPNLLPSYAGPFLVLPRTDKTFKIVNNDKVQHVQSITSNPALLCTNRLRLQQTPRFFHRLMLRRASLQIILQPRSLRTLLLLPKFLHPQSFHLFLLRVMLTILLLLLLLNTPISYQHPPGK